jgi:hypothetical protein
MATESMNFDEIVRRWRRWKNRIGGRRLVATNLGGDEGDRYVAQADAAMQAEGVRAPARMAAMLFPGRWDAGSPPL